MGESVERDFRIDRLSSLPDAVLSHILSFLPLNSVVCTSILSTRWRYLYTSLTSLDFDFNYDYSDAFMNFVDRMLFALDRTCIQRFSLRRCHRLGKDDCIYRVGGWIYSALRRGVQELYLDMLDPEVSSGVLPVSLFTNKTLVKFVLRFPGLFVMKIPTKVCFPSLKTLHLENVNFINKDSILRLLSGCLVLEELIIRCYDMWNITELNISHPSLKRLTITYIDSCGTDHHHRIVIDAPSLVDFKIFNVARGIFLLSPHSLVNARLEYLFDLGDFNLVIAANLLKGISNVRSLSATPDILRASFLCNKPLPVFCNLVCLEIADREDRCKDDASTELLEFLESSPNLETLIFDDTAFEGLTLNPSAKVPSCLLSSLKVIEIYSFGGSMKPVEYFLKNASALEKLKIQMGWKVEKQDEMKMKLLMLPRESKICQVEIVLT
ncbi:hypothetical protein PTKIN_Ptkin10aG0120900 [Pterospermum kingtungense]